VEKIVEVSAYENYKFSNWRWQRDVVWLIARGINAYRWSGVEIAYVCKNID
jgi:hypothetical protein